LCRLLDLDEYASAQTDDDRQDEIRAALAVVFATRTRNEWVELLGPADTCVAPVNTVAEACADEQYVARNNLADAVSATNGPFRQSAPIWAGTALPDGPYAVPDGAATQTAGLLLGAGCDPADIDSWLADGVIG
jgi:alpha-methylacyl-CoA racemase